MWRRRERRAPGSALPEAAPAAPRTDHVLPRSTGHGELLFAVPGNEPGSLQLDCLLWDEDLGASVPITVLARLPQDSLAGYLSAMTVDTWCANHEDVEVQVWLAGRRPRLALSCRNARVVLSLPSA